MDIHPSNIPGPNPLGSHELGKTGTSAPSQQPILPAAEPQAVSAENQQNFLQYSTLARQLFSQQANPFVQSGSFADIKRQYLKSQFNIDLPNVNLDTSKP
jgi:hypothetical protein